jgi:hypothetical protein
LRSGRQSGGAHFVQEFLRAARVQIAAQQTADLGRLGVELLDQAAQIVAGARQLRLQFVEFAGQSAKPSMWPAAGPDRSRRRVTGDVRWASSMVPPLG